MSNGWMENFKTFLKEQNQEPNRENQKIFSCQPVKPEVKKQLTTGGSKKQTAVYRFSCAVNNTCSETFNTDYELENHAIKVHSDMKLSKVDINELHLGRFKSENKRLKTFEKWGFTSVDPKDLAKAGFVYTGREDEVCLFTNLNPKKFNLVGPDMKF